MLVDYLSWAVMTSALLSPSRAEALAFFLLALSSEDGLGLFRWHVVGFGIPKQ